MSSPYFIGPAGGGSSAAGSSGAKNYLGTVNGTNLNGDFELGTTSGWSLGNASLTSNLPTGAPTFGSGASGNLSISAVTSGKLAGTYSLSYASSAATTAGDFLASDAFTIDTEDQAKVLTFKFYYSPTSNPTNGNWSGTTSNSFGVAIYDVTNSAWIIPAGVFSMTQGSGVGIATGTFQTTSNSTSYRLCVYNANASAGAITVLFDDMYLGPQTAPIGVPAGEWTETWVDNQTNATTSVKLQRLGPYIFASGEMTWTGAGDTNLQVTIPAAYTADSASYPFGTTTHYPVGTAMLQDTSPATFDQGSVQLVSNVNLLNIYLYNSSGTYATVANPTATIPWTWASGDKVTFEAKWKVSGWSSNVQMSNDTDTRVVAFKATRSADQTGVNPNGTFVKVTFNTAANDTHGAFDTTNSRYVCQVAGRYVFSACIPLNSTNVLANVYGFTFYKNGSAFDSGVRQTVAVTTGTYFNASSSPMVLVPGDYVEVFFLGVGNNSVSTLTLNTDMWFSGERLSGPAVVAATESVNARYSTAAAQSIANGGSEAIIDFGTKTFDSHNAVTTGGSWKFTAPSTGKYSVSCLTLLTANSGWAANEYCRVFLYKNGVSQCYMGTYIAESATASLNIGVQGTTTISLNAGDYIDLRIFQNSGGAITLAADALTNYVDIYRVGN